MIPRKLTFKGCYLESTFYGAEQLNTIASMPTKEETIAGIIGSVLMLLHLELSGALNAVMRDLVSVIDEVRKN